MRFRILLLIPLLAGLLQPVVAFAANETACCTCTKKEAIAQGNFTCVTVPVDEGGDGCAALPTNYPNMKDYVCTTTPSPELNCASKKSSASGICTIGPIDVKAVAPSVGEKQTQTAGLTVPRLGVAIPGLTFSNSVDIDGREVDIPFFAQYISAIYRYLIAIAAIAAAIMIVYGGFLMIFSQTGAKVRQGREVITDAIIGLILILAAYLILDAINPNLTQLNNIKLKGVKGIQFLSDGQYQNIQQQAAASGYEPDKDIKQAVAAASGGAAPTRQLPDNPFDPRTSLPPAELESLVRKIATQKGVDACIAIAIIRNESGGHQNAIGHDEDAPLVNTQSRLDFLRSKVKYSGTTFEDTGIPEANCTEAACGALVKLPIVNDDVLSDNPPEFGLDWRFSHGFGAGQFTVPKKGGQGFCTGSDGAYGISFGGKCFTVPILLTWEGQLEAMMLRIKASQNASPCQTFCSYGGLCQLDPSCTGPQLSKRIKSYEECKSTP